MPLFESRDAAASPRDEDALPELVGTAPVDGSVLERAPERVVVRFKAGIESRHMRLSCTGPSGSTSLAVEGTGGEPVQELSIPVPNQGRGKYVVQWELTTLEGNRLKGKVRFVTRR
jgi:methionine-rich copper-binding protein CopC